MRRDFISEPENGVGQFVVRHSTHSILSDIREWCEAGISLGLIITRDTINGTVDLLILCRCHRSSQLIAVPTRCRRRTAIEPFRANYLIALGELYFFQGL